MDLNMKKESTKGQGHFPCTQAITGDAVARLKIELQGRDGAESAHQKIAREVLGRVGRGSQMR